MATIDDFGDTADPLNAPALGGASGWAAAVRDYLKDLMSRKVEKTGDTMTGNLSVSPPVSGGSALNVAPGSGYAGLNVTSADQHAGVNLRSKPGYYKGIAFQNVDAVMRWIFMANTSGESGSNAGSNLNIVRYSDAGAVLGTAVSIERATGKVTLETDPTTPLGIATKQYVDTADGLKAPLASPALTGNPTAPTPTTGDNDTSIATTAFVNAEIAADAVLKAGSTMTGALTLSGAPTSDLHASTKKYVDDGLGAQLSLANIRTGTVTAPIANNANNGSIAVTWSALPGAPRVVATVTNTSVWMASVSNITATGCTITVRHVDATFTGTANIPIDYIAIYGVG